MDITASDIEKVLARITDEGLRQDIGAIIDALLEQNKLLQDRVALLERQLFGSKSEKKKLTKDQSNTGTDLAALFDASECDEITTVQTTETITYTRNKPSRNRRGRFDTSTLPQRTDIHDLPDAEKFCNQCNGELEHIGDDESQQVESIPAQHILVKHVCPKYACRCCNIIVSGKKEPSAIPKAMVGNSVIAQVVVDKYVNHLPIYRQAQIYTRQGFAIDDITIGRWIMKLGSILQPLHKALWKLLLENTYLQVDETPTLCLESKKKCYMWVYTAFQDRRPNLVIFDFQMTRGQIAVNTKLHGFKGVVQTDGYGGYNTIRKRPDIVGIGCGAHIRRKFDAVNHLAEDKSPAANKVIDYFKKLYDIEDIIRQKVLQPEQCKKLRQEQAKPILNELHSYLTELLPQVPPKSPLGKAIIYALDEWPYWVQYIEHGDAFIDTNWVENQIRPFGIGRRNWLFIGNQSGGETSALLYSLTQSAKLNNLDPWHYIFYILNHVHDLRKGNIKAENLLPHNVNPDDVANLATQHIEKFTKLLHELNNSS